MFHYTYNFITVGYICLYLCMHARMYAWSHIHVLIYVAVNVRPNNANQSSPPSSIMFYCLSSPWFSSYFFSFIGWALGLCELVRRQAPRHLPTKSYFSRIMWWLSKEPITPNLRPLLYLLGAAAPAAA